MYKYSYLVFILAYFAISTHALHEYSRELLVAEDYTLPWPIEQVEDIKRNLLTNEEAQEICSNVKYLDENECPEYDGKQYCYYCEFKKCWKREGARLDDGKNCNTNLPDAENCPDLREPNPVPCPEGLDLTIAHPKEQVKQGIQFNIDSSLDLGMLEPVPTPCEVDTDDFGLIPHANVHGCVKNSTTWWCSELVPAFQPKSVLTTPSKCLNDTDDNTFTMTVDKSTLAPPNEWTIYAHYYFYSNATADGEYTKWHVTSGKVFVVEGRELAIGSGVATYVISFGITLTIFPTLITGLLICCYRKHWVMVASSVPMCQLMVFGAFLGCAAIFAFDPALLSDSWCRSRQWLLPLAFDFLVIPMCLKTWRVHKLFSSSFRSVRITNKMLCSVLAGVVLVEIIFNLVWTLLDGGALRRTKNFSTLDRNAFEYECQSDNLHLQNIFTAVSIAIHLIPCIMLTFFAYSVRLSFKYSRVNRKLHEFDESLYIMLSLLNITVVGLFVLIFQALIESNPEIVTIMRTGGLGYIVASTLLLMFVPKFIRIAKWDSNQDEPAPIDSLLSSSMGGSSGARKSRTPGGNSYLTSANTTNIVTTANGLKYTESGFLLNQAAIEQARKEIEDENPFPGMELEPLSSESRLETTDTSFVQSEDIASSRISSMYLTNDSTDNNRMSTFVSQSDDASVNPSDALETVNPQYEY